MDGDEFPLGPDELERWRVLAEQALVTEGVTAGELQLVFIDERTMTELNEAHMGKTGPTDVLSFPLLPPGAYPPHPGQDPALREGPPGPAFVLPPDEPVHLGEIVVSVERARAQADEGHGGQTGTVKWSPADELRLLLTHGALHLCGWDHADPEEEAAMRALERELLAAG